MGQIDVADGIVHLVKIFGIVIVGGHTLQLTYHLLAVVLSQHFGLGYAGVKLQLVRRTAAYHTGKSLVSLLLMAHQVLYLSHQVPLAGTLGFTAFVLDGLAQIGHGLGVIGHADVIVGVGVIPILNGTEIHRVATHVTNHVLGIVSPAQHSVAFGQPRTGQSAAGRIAQVQACHVREGSGSLFKLSHLELCLTKHQPCFPQKRVLLAPFHLNGVALDGFLHLLNRSLVMRFAYVATQFVANGVKRQQFGKVILVALLFLQISIQKGHVTVIIGVIAGVEGVPEPALGGVFVLRKAHGCHQRDNQHHAHISPIPSHYSLFTNHYSLILFCFFSSSRQCILHEPSSAAVQVEQS